MISRRELLQSISECESSDRVTYQTIGRLANLYTIYDHLYGTPTVEKPIAETFVDVSGESEFLQLVNGKDSAKVWPLVDELVSCIQVTQPRLYELVIRQLKSLDQPH